MKEERTVCVSIDEAQYQWCRDACINISALLRKTIDDNIKEASVNLKSANKGND